MNLINRSIALSRVKKLTAEQKLVAWGIAWDMTTNHMAEIMRVDTEKIDAYAEEIAAALECSKSGIGLTMILAEGLRTPDLTEWPALRVKPLQEAT